MTDTAPSKVIHFSVDSALLRELGERLVGKPHIALSELIKNSYDADARKVTVIISDDRIEVSDNGHGMTYDEFRNFWMRVGTPHKQGQRLSRHSGRPLTGSKGVGRLAVQFLAQALEIRTVSDDKSEDGLMALVDWEQSIQAGELTSAQAEYDFIGRAETFPDGSDHGTTVVLTKLNQSWVAHDVAKLAQEIWSLQPPFRANPRLTSDWAKDFAIDLRSDDPQKVAEFETHMSAYLGLWDTKIVGELIGQGGRDSAFLAKIRLTLEFADRPGEPKVIEYEIRDCPIHLVEFEVRVFYLAGRQKYGIKVQEARNYFNEFGGIHIYDAGFHLPYYGPETDWLEIEIDHSHRLSRSKLLPEELQVPLGLNNLPTTSRLFGVVHVDTALERRGGLEQEEMRSSDRLGIQITRDRLVDNQAFSGLKRIVRWALDFYAMEQTRRRFLDAHAFQSIEPVTRKVERVEEVLDRFSAEISPPAFMEIKARLREATRASQTEAEIIAHRMSLLAPLATAGMCALAYEHEVGKQFQVLEAVAARLRRILTRDPSLRNDLDSIGTEIDRWVARAKATRGLFSHLASPENHETRTRFKARNLLEQVKEQVRVLVRDLSIDATGVEPALRLPEGTFAEWSAIFQNVLFNASNSMMDVERRSVSIHSTKDGRERSIRIEDTGVGVDLHSSEELFEPFIRRLQISAERRALGLGGSGIGLTIVRMIADSLGCSVSFAEPTPGFSTCFELTWRERE